MVGSGPLSTSIARACTGVNIYNETEILQKAQRSRKAGIVTGLPLQSPQPIGLLLASALHQKAILKAALGLLHGLSKRSPQIQGSGLLN